MMARRPTSLLRRAPAMLRGRRHPHLTPEHGYRSAEVTAVSLGGIDGYALDGELFPVGPDQSLQVAATEPVAFLSL